LAVADDRLFSDDHLKYSVRLRDMQDTRRLILDILKQHHEAAVDEIVDELRRRRGDITAVTVRHHLSLLQKEGLISTPQLRHRSAPGRPQYIYSLTEMAKDYFPNDYQFLAARLVEQIQQLPLKQANVILEGVADQMAAAAYIENNSLAQRLNQVVEYLNEHGYNAQWEKHSEGYVLRTNNCPYHHISERTQSLCEMDMRLVASLLGVVPRLMERISGGDSSCAYLIPEKPG
jgi:predicted ArsR family transcriptional regulator